MNSETLADRLRAGPLSVREATQICRALLSAIEESHARGVGHGAIHPSTVTLRAGRAVLAETTTQSADTPTSDVYAVAALLYESISGRPWPAGSNPDRADWSGVPRRLRRALKKALSTTPERRWPNAAAFQRALWVPRPSHPIWPAVVVIAFAALVIAAIVFCKPLGLCWERPAAEEVR
jgi:serine/threonine protein kinase